MLPLYLSIEGLYSYQKKQEIDFTQLTEAGLFGIFGAVGSGKSSILEAISYALYGETERLNRQEKRAYNMLNLKSDSAIIDFQFLNFENRKFRFITQWRRKKKFEDTTTIERLAYEDIDGNWIPLESADATMVTNLSYANFRRTIIIPQGQFREFLELKGKERSEMMKEIFFLNQYDLGPRVANLSAENNKKLEHLKGALTGFDQISEELIQEKNDRLIESRKSLHILKEEFEKLQAEIKNLQVARENRLNLAQKQQDLNKLLVQQRQIEATQRELEEYEAVTSQFAAHIHNLHTITAQREQLLRKIEQLKENKHEYRSIIEEAEKQLLSLQDDFTHLDDFRKKIDDYKLLDYNLILQQQIQDYKNRVNKGTPILVDTIAHEKELSDNLLTFEKQIQELKNSKINSSELLNIENWYNQLDHIVRTEGDILSKLSIIENEIKVCRDQFKKLGLSEDNWQKELELRREALQEQQKDLQDKDANLRVKQELSQFIQNLRDHEPCPLCGSKDHPSIMHADDLTAELDKLRRDKHVISEQENQTRQVLQDALQLSNSIGLKERSLSELSKELEAVKKQKEQHYLTFSWTEFDPYNRGNFEEKKQYIQHLEAEITEKEKELQSLRENLQKTKDNIKRYEKTLDDLKYNVKILESNIEQNSKQLKILLVNEPTARTKESIVKHSKLLTEKIAYTESAYTSWSEKLVFAKTQLASISGQFTEAHAQYVNFSEQLQVIQKTINGLLIKFNFADITQVKGIIQKNLDVAGLRARIQAFFVQVNSLQTIIAELTAITQQDNYSEEHYQLTIHLHHQKAQQLEEQVSLVGGLEKEITRLELELNKKIDLLTEFEKLSVRKENLRLLDNMFKGNGFVNYVSSIHLQRLCEIANQRFLRLTKNQLSLCINDANEFEVIDYLNNGYHRSVKTLSGGQSFQASLCLALALAENIQALNKADRNFFFIDEGFGTQDTDSINTVFDTLQYLHQENRVVGIISHVEELKERMPRAISVVKDPTTGSKVYYQ